MPTRLKSLISSSADRIGTLRKTKFLALAVLPIVACALLSMPTVGVKGAFAWGAVALVFYAVFFAGLLLPRAWEVVKSIGVMDWIASVLLAVAVGVFLYLVLGQERYIFSWDQGSYWYAAQDEASALALHPKQTLIEAARSINTATYNDVAPLLVSIPLALFGGSYSAFAALITPLFSLPCALCAHVAASVALGVGDGRRLPLWVSSMVMFGYPAFALSQIKGYSDMAACLMACVAILALASIDARRPDWKAGIVMGAAALFAVLVRRYFANWDIGLAAGAMAYMAVLVAQSGARRYKVAISLAATFAIAALVAAAIALAFFQPFLKHAIFGDYAFAYQAYDNGTGWMGKIQSLAWYSGLLIAALFVASLVASFVERRTRALGVSLGTILVVSCIMFWRIQDMGWQHYLIVAPEVLTCCLIGAGVLLRAPFFRKGRLGVAVAALSLSVWCVASVAVYSGAVTYFEWMAPAFGTEHHVIRVREDFDQLRQISGSLADDDVVWVASSSTVMNESLLMNTFREFSPCGATVIGDNIDERDGFKMEFFDANKVIVCDPPQTHRPREHQRVITELVPMLLDSDGPVGKHYTAVGTWRLEQGVTAYLLERASPFDEGDVRAVEKVYDSFYKSYPSLFHDRFEAYIFSHFPRASTA